MSVPSLLRAALEILEQQEARRGSSRTRFGGIEGGMADASEVEARQGRTLLMDVDEAEDPSAADSEAPAYAAVREEWFGEEDVRRCLRVRGDAMAPILSDGAVVVFSDRERSPVELDGKLVVAWQEGQPIVRWFQNCGRFALLRAENPAVTPAQILVDLESHAEARRIRKVLWVNSQH